MLDSSVMERVYDSTLLRLDGKGMPELAYSFNSGDPIFVNESQVHKLYDPAVASDIIQCYGDHLFVMHKKDRLSAPKCVKTRMFVLG